MTRYRLPVAALALAMFCLTSTASSHGRTITSPKEAFGSDIGDDYFLVNYTQYEAYLKTLARQSDRLKVVDIGPTEEGRRQYMAVISSPANIARLEHYRRIAGKMAKADGVDEAEAKALASEGKAVVWIDGGLHATEVAAAQALIAGIYDMLSRDDPETRRILDDVVILFSQINPDGMELVSNWYMRNSEKEKREYQNIPSLYQKYIGHDNNRDYYMSAMKETENVNNIFFRQWYPQIIYNHHQRSPAGTVVFVPPFRGPFNYNYDPLVITTLGEIGSAMNGRLIAEGKSGAITSDGASFTTWTNGMERTVTYFHNAVGLLTEIMGTPAPIPLPLIAKHQIARNDLPAPATPQLWHFRQSIDYSLTLNRAVLDYASRNRERLLMNIWRMGSNAIERGRRDNWTITPKRIAALEEAAKGKPLVGSGFTQGLAPDLYETVLHDPVKRDPRGYIVPADQPDFPTAVRFLNALIKTGVDVQQATKGFVVAGKSYPAGSYVVKTDQAYRPHILDMFEPQDHPRQQAYAGGPPVLPYDVTGYTLAMQMGVRYDRVLEDLAGPFAPVRGVLPTPRGAIMGAGVTGFIVSHESNASFVLANRLLREGQLVYWVKGHARVGGVDLPPGALWIPATPVSRAIVTSATDDLGVTAHASDLAPAQGMIRLRPTRIGLVDKYGGSIPAGWLRWLMEQFEFDYKLVYPQRLDAGQLREDFDVLLFADGLLDEPKPADLQPVATDIPEAFRHRLGQLSREKTVPQIAAFLRSGGAVTTVGSSARLAQMMGLPVTTELKGEDGKPLPQDQFFIPGSLLELTVDNSMPLAFGAPPTMQVFVDRDSPVIGIEGASVAARYAREDVLRSGWAIGQEKLSNSPAIVEAGLGEGKLFLLGPEVAQRGQSHAAFKFLFNSLHYGGAVPGDR